MIAKPGDPLDLPGDARELVELNNDVRLSLFQVTEVAIEEPGDAIGAGLTGIDDRFDEIRRQTLPKVPAVTGLGSGVGKG